MLHEHKKDDYPWWFLISYLILRSFISAAIPDVLTWPGRSGKQRAYKVNEIHLDKVLDACPKYDQETISQVRVDILYKEVSSFEIVCFDVQKGQW